MNLTARNALAAAGCERKRAVNLRLAISQAFCFVFEGKFLRYRKHGDEFANHAGLRIQHKKFAISWAGFLPVQETERFFGQGCVTSFDRLAQTV